MVDNTCLFLLLWSVVFCNLKLCGILRKYSQVILEFGHTSTLRDAVDANVPGAATHDWEVRFEHFRSWGGTCERWTQYLSIRYHWSSEYQY